MTEIPTLIQNFTRDFGPVRPVILVIRYPPCGCFGKSNFQESATSF